MIPARDVENQGFRYPRRKRRTTQSLDSRFDARREEYLNSDFHRAINDLQFPDVQRIVVLGLGTLRHSPSLFQLSLGLELRDRIGCSIIASDPMFTASDRAFLEKHEIKVKELDIATMDTDVKTLVYAPHVPKSVYEVVLRTFWKTLDNLVLLGNNLAHYRDM